MNKYAALPLTLLLLTTACATKNDTTAEEHPPQPTHDPAIAQAIQTWKAAIQSGDPQALAKIYAENFTGDFPPEVFASDFKGFIAESEIVTDEATITRNGNTATVGPLYIDHAEAGLELNHTLTKQANSWKITNTKAQEAE